MSRDEAHHYLAIPVDYCRWLGGLRWCSNGEAVEHTAPTPAIGCTFAMAGEIALFLEGYSTGGPLIGFGFILHLLHLLGRGVSAPNSQEPGARFADLAAALRETGLPIRNAGALCAMLCRDVPPAPDPPDLTELGLSLRFPVAIPFYQRRSSRRAEVPPLEPAEFEALVYKSLSRLTPDEMRHWLRFGRGPIVGAGEAVARHWTRDFSTLLTGLGERPRLAAAMPFVERLGGALALPPRRLAESERPTGGYADITTRGRPEHLLPTQFALDELEFVRRFAERELLYFHREEPRAPAADGSLIVLDQGVRTWGDVRLVLAAAALALVRRAARRGTLTRLVSTAIGSRPVEPTALDPDGLGAVLEASDLSLHPGAVLGSVLDEPAVRPRDVVLLTHPRSLHEPEVAAAARRVTAPLRLFAVTVAASGEVELAELRRGVPVRLGRCRIDVCTPGESTVTKAPAAQSGSGAWQGDVERMASRLTPGLFGSLRGPEFDIDGAANWLLAGGGGHGLLHAWRIDGTRAEMLPRALSSDGRVVTDVHSILGVAGGFVVFGGDGRRHIAAHYNFTTRVCTAHVISPRVKPLPWFYLPYLHSVVAVDADGNHHALDLAVARERAGATARVAAACRLVAGAGFQSGPAIVAAHDRFPPQGRAVRINPALGEIVVQFAPGLVRSYTLRNEGEPLLERGRIIEARAGGHVIATLVRTPQQTSLIAFVNQDASSVETFALPRTAASFRLSRNGRLVVYPSGPRQLQVREIGGGPLPRFVTPTQEQHA